MASRKDFEQRIDDVIEGISMIFPSLTCIILRFSDIRRRIAIGLLEVERALDVAAHDEDSSGKMHKVLKNIVRRVLLQECQDEASESDALKSDKKAKRKAKRSKFVQSSAREVKQARLEREEKSSTRSGKRQERKAQTGTYPDIDEEKEETELWDSKEPEPGISHVPGTFAPLPSHVLRSFRAPPSAPLPALPADPVVSPPPVQLGFGEWISMSGKKDRERKERSRVEDVIDLCSSSSDSETEREEPSSTEREEASSTECEESSSFEDEPDEEKAPGNVRGEFSPEE